MESSLNIQKIVKPSFAVIGIEGSTDDGEGFIPMLWSDANAHFDEVSPVASRDENGALLVRRADGAVSAVQAGEVSVRGLYGYTT